MAGAASSAAPSNVELTYWGIRGLGAVPRAALTLAGIAFSERNPASYEQWCEWRDAEMPTNPCVDLPMLTVGSSGLHLAQHGTILKWIESQSAALQPPADRVWVADMAMEVLRDVQAQRAKISYGPQAADNFPAAFKILTERYLPRLEQLANQQQGAFLICDKPLIVDLFLTELFDGLTKGKQLKDHPDVQTWLDAFPKIKAIIAAVKSHAALAEYWRVNTQMPFNSPAAANWF